MRPERVLRTSTKAFFSIINQCKQEAGPRDVSVLVLYISFMEVDLPGSGVAASSFSMLISVFDVGNA